MTIDQSNIYGLRIASSTVSKIVPYAIGKRYNDLFHIVFLPLRESKKQKTIMWCAQRKWCVGRTLRLLN